MSYCVVLVYEYMPSFFLLYLRCSEGPAGGGVYFYRILNVGVFLSVCV